MPFTLEQFPAHDGSLNICHNPQNDFSETVERLVKCDVYGTEEFENDDAIKKCIESNELWAISWWCGNTYRRVLAPTLEDAMRIAGVKE